MQTVTRTRLKRGDYYYEIDSFQRLKNYLEDGYKVVMCNRIGEELEYILEKEEAEEQQWKD